MTEILEGRSVWTAEKEANENWQTLQEHLRQVIPTDGDCYEGDIPQDDGTLKHVIVSRHGDVLRVGKTYPTDGMDSPKLGSIRIELNLATKVYQQDTVEGGKVRSETSNIDDYTAATGTVPMMLKFLLSDMADLAGVKASEPQMEIETTRFAVQSLVLDR